MYILLVGKDKTKYDQIVEWFNNFLNNGHTYESIRNEILGCFYDDHRLNVQYFSNKYTKEDCNLLKQGEVYYHNELKITAKPPTINLDIEKGTMVSSEHKYFLERRASYTIKDLLRYFYSRNMADVQEYNYYRMKGLFLYKVKQFGLDTTLFMIEGMYRDFVAEQKIFNINNFDSYLGKAKQFINDCKENTQQPYYQPRQRTFD